MGVGNVVSDVEGEARLGGVCIPLMGGISGGVDGRRVRRRFLIGKNRENRSGYVESYPDRIERDGESVRVSWGVVLT